MGENKELTYEVLPVKILESLSKSGSGLDRNLRPVQRGSETQPVVRKAKDFAHITREALLYPLLHASNDGFLVVNQEGRVLFFNPAVKSILQRSSTELLSMPFKIPIIVEEITNGTVLTEERTEDIDVRVVEIELQGETHYLIYLHLVSERNRLEKALRESELLIQRSINSSTEAILITDAKLIVQYSNDIARRIFGFNVMEFQGMPLTSLIPEALVCSPAGNESRIQSNDVQPTIQEQLETTGKRKSGEEFQLELMSKAWIVGEKRNFMWVIRDMTHLQKAQETAKLQDRLAAVGQLAAGIAHDFNNILGTIILYSESLLKKPELQTEDHERINMIFNQARRGAVLTSQILDFSRRSVMEPRPIDLVKYLDEIKNLLSSTIPASIRISTIVQEEQLVICADTTRLQQIFVNLALNAKDAMPEGGDIRFELSRIQVHPQSLPPYRDIPSGEWVKIQIDDTGVGIPGKILNRIFEPFFTTKGPGKGTGLGLAQVYGIVKQHQGYIDVASEVGKGTTFTIYLPSAVSSEVEEVNLEAPIPVNGGEETILIVEDDLASRRSICDILESLKYKVLPAANGQEAMEIYTQRDGAVDLILSDLVMPDMDGRQLYSILSRDHPDVKIILMTGYPLGNGTRELLDRRRVTWLQKPFTSEVLAGAIRTMLNSTLDE